MTAEREMTARNADRQRHSGLAEVEPQTGQDADSTIEAQVPGAAHSDIVVGFTGFPVSKVSTSTRWRSVGL
jgi:hypothetical protein